MICDVHAHYLPRKFSEFMGDRFWPPLGQAGRTGLAKKALPKEAVSLRLDPDILAHFRAGGPGWQSRINAALRKAAGL